MTSMDPSTVPRRPVPLPVVVLALVFGRATMLAALTSPQSWTKQTDPQAFS